MNDLALRRVRVVLPLALLLASLQPAVPAAAQVVGAAGIEAAAARGGTAGAAALSAPAFGTSLAVPSFAPSFAPSPAPSLSAPAAAPSFSAAPTFAPALRAAALPSAASLPLSAAPAASPAAAPAAAPAPALAVGIPAAQTGAESKSAAALRPASLPANAAEVDGARFDGATVRAAAADGPECGSCSLGAESPKSPSRLSRALSAPLRFAARPAVAVWKKAAGSVATIRENASWVRSFWAGLRADGVNVSKELRTASTMALVIAAVTLVPSWLYGQMAQRLHELQGIAGGATPWYQVPVLQTFAALSVALIAAHALGAWLTKFQSKTMYDLGNKLMKGVSDLYVAKVLSLDMRWQNGRGVGDVVSTATDAIYTMQSTASAMVVDLVRHGAVALIAGAVMAVVSWKLSLFSIPFLIFALSIPSSVYGKRVQDAYRGFFAAKKPKFASALQEIVVNILKVKSSGLEERELAKMREHSRQTYLVGGGEIAEVAAPQRALAGGLTDVARVLVMAAAIVAVVAGAMPLSAAITYIFLSNFFRESVQALSGLWVSLKSMRGAAARYDATMKQASEDLNLGGTVLPPTRTGRRIEMNGVKFRYSKDGAPVLKGVDLTIEPGQMVGFVGMTGGGKTTTAMAVLGLYPLESGEVKIDGVPLSQMNLRAFRSEVGTALQDSIPFAGTIRENIAYLRPNATEAEIWEAAKAAGLHDQIARFGADRVLSGPEADAADGAALKSAADSLEAVRAALRDAGVAGVPTAPLDAAKSLRENAVGTSGASWEQFAAAAERAGATDAIVRLGYGARVGERGLNLSGGQKQRLMLAQLFVQPRNPFGVMIYDEPTSALDGRTQALIEDQIAERRGKTTQIVIAHRLSNVQRADKIVVFADGQVAEVGTHAELMAKGGVYAKMWDAQRLLDAASAGAAR